MGEKMDKKIVLITGASSGFGKLAVRNLAEKGYFVIATMRNKAKEISLLEEIKKEKLLHQVDTFLLDVTDDKQIDARINEIKHKYGRIDVLINNAGYSQGGLIENTHIDRWKEQFDTNLFGVVRVTKAVLPFMRERREGKIINVGSISGRIGLPGMGPYAASKFALAGFSESLYFEMAPFNIHVSLIEAGSYKTNIWQKALSNVERSIENDYEILMNKLMDEAEKTSRNAADPSEVIQLIHKICSSGYPKFRYQIGRGVKLAIFLKSIMPWSIVSKSIQHKINN